MGGAGRAGPGRTPRRGDKFVTVIIDLTPVRAGTGPGWLLDMVDGRSKQVFKTWLTDRGETWRKQVDVVGRTSSAGSRPPLPRSFPGHR